jgi:hypothetical protein
MVKDHFYDQLKVVATDMTAQTFIAKFEEMGYCRSFQGGETKTSSAQYRINHLEKWM